MQLKLVRQTYTDNSTIGQLMLDGNFECFTLEDVVRPTKMYGETAIPAGSYQVVISMSERFKTRLPLLVDVPEFTGVRIHPGNTKADTLGCVLVGQSQSTDSIGASRAAFAALMPKLEAAAQHEKIVLEIVDRRAPSSRGRAAASVARGATRGVRPAPPARPGASPAIGSVAKKAPRKAAPATTRTASKSTALPPAAKPPRKAATKKAGASTRRGTTKPAR